MSDQAWLWDAIISLPSEIETAGMVGRRFGFVDIVYMLSR